MLLTRHNEPAGRVLLWEPDVSKRLGDPTFIMKRTLENDKGVESNTRTITIILHRVAREENFNVSMACIRCKYNLNRYKLEVVSVFWVLIPSTDVIQLTLTLKMTTAQVVETLVTVKDNSPIQDHIHPDDQTQSTFDMFWVYMKSKLMSHRAEVQWVTSPAQCRTIA